MLVSAESSEVVSEVSALLSPQPDKVIITRRAARDSPPNLLKNLFIITIKFLSIHILLKTLHFLAYRNSATDDIQVTVAATYLVNKLLFGSQVFKRNLILKLVEAPHISCLDS